ncbi:MAG: solA [Subtercola sp.]|nr:solA [Subtercola sp.]
MKPRIAVIGIGSMGSQVLYQLAKAGADVVGFESYTPGHDRGAGAGDTRIFRSAHFEDSRWVPILTRADALWDELSAATGRELRSLTGCILMGPSDHGQMATALASIAEHGLDHELMDARTLTDRYPQFRGVDGDVAIFDRRAGFLRPELTILATTLLAVSLGATVHKATRVVDVREVADGVVVQSSRGVEAFDRVIVTAGPWINRLMPEFEELITVRRPISAWYARRDPALSWEPTFIRTGPRHFYAVPSPDGVTVKIGLSVVDHQVINDPDTIDRDIRLEELAPFTEMIETYVPGLLPDAVRVTPYVEGYVEDTRPIIRSQPGGRGITVMAGFSGHGFKLASAFGEIGAQLVMTGRSTLPIEFLQRGEAVPA